MPEPSQKEYFSRITINVKDFNGKPITGELVTIMGTRRKKSVKLISDINGNVVAFVPKGDMYSVNFKYDKDFSSTEFFLFRGSSTIDLRAWISRYKGN